MISNRLKVIVVDLASFAGCLGIAALTYAMRGRDAICVAIPIIIFGGIFVPLITWARLRQIEHEEREARKKDGLCHICSYSLEGNISGICPECGTAIEPILPPRYPSDRGVFERLRDLVLELREK